MSLDVVDLRNFYGQPLGALARRTIGRVIRARWDNLTGQRVLGLGYPTPYLGLFRADAERCLAFMPAAQGVVNWPSAAPCLSALVEDAELPLADAAMDRVLVVHALEMADQPGETLRDVWRVLAAGGRLMLVVPNRRGIWARSDTTPFGHGRPYSRSQLMAMLREASFTPTWWSEALYMPPLPWMMSSSSVWEKIGAGLSMPLAGVHVVEATKQVFRAQPVRERKRFVFAPEPVLSPAPSGRVSAACAPAGTPPAHRTGSTPTMGR